jgi:hypothetical protein
MLLAPVSLGFVSPVAIMIYCVGISSVNALIVSATHCVHLGSVNKSTGAFGSKGITSAIFIQDSGVKIQLDLDLHELEERTMVHCAVVAIADCRVWPVSGRFRLPLILF